MQLEGNAGVADLYLLREGSRVVRGFAIETLRNVPWFGTTDQLVVSPDGKLTGTLRLTQGSDGVTEAGRRAAEKAKGQAAPLPAARVEDVTLTLTSKNGRIEGTIAPAAKSDAGFVSFRKDPISVRGSILPQLPSQGIRVEMMPFGVGGRGGADLDSATGAGVVLLFNLQGGKIHEAFLRSLTNPRPRMELTGLIGVSLVRGDEFKAKLPISTKAAAGANGMPNLDGTLSVDGTIVGDYAVGKATWETAGAPLLPTSFRARISRAKVQPSLAFSTEPWPPQGEELKADPQLAARAEQDSLAPLRPGEPGRQAFYSTRPINMRKFFALYPPSLEFAEVSGAVRYRLTITPSGEAGKGRSWSTETDKPWLPPTSIWKDIPPGPMTLSAIGLDAKGNAVGKAEIPAQKYPYVGGHPLDESHWKMRAKQVRAKDVQFAPVSSIELTRRAPFNGPYWRPTRGMRESALAQARWVRDGELTGAFRGLASWGAFTGGDGGENVIIASFVRACCLVCLLSDDEVERREALQLAERAAWQMYLAHKGRLPRVYKDNVSLMLWLGLCYLDLFAIDADERFRGAALDLAKALADSQHANGGWPGEKQPWPGGVFGPSEFRTNGAESTLWYLGRVRKQLGVRDFIATEARADAWVKKMSLPAMTWQNVGYHSAEMTPVQDTVAPHALAYAVWLLDYSEDPASARKIVEDIARWSEERHVDWSRNRDPKTHLTTPSCWGWSRAAGTGVRVGGSLMYVFARLGEETRDPLWTAKAQALAQGIQAAQDPRSGGFAFAFHRTPEDVISHHPYDALEAASRLIDLDRIVPKSRK